MKIALCPNFDMTKNRLELNEIITQLHQEHELLMNVCYFDVVDHHEQITEWFQDTDLMIASSQIILSLGGDGAILRVCEYSAKYQIPIFGINFGHLGFLTAIEKSEYQRINEYLSKELILSKRSMLEVEIQDDHLNLKSLVANDVAICSKTPCKMIHLSMWTDEEKVGTFRADGAIVCTPTGSTGHSLSAGGPIIIPSTDVICMTPMSSHSLFSVPMIFPSKTVMHFNGRSNGNDSDLCVSLDGKDAIVISEQAEITIRQSNDYFYLAQTQKSRYFEIVNHKLLQF